MRESEAKGMLEALEFVKKVLQYILVVATIVLMLFMCSCKAKKTITKTETKEQIEETTVEELFAGSEKETETETTKTEERTSDEVHGRIPFDWDSWFNEGQDSTGFQIKSDGIDVDVSVTDSQIIIKGKSEANIKSTEVTKTKEIERDTISHTQEEIVIKEKEEKSKISEKSKPKLIWPIAVCIPIFFLLVGYLYDIYKRKTR